MHAALNLILLCGGSLSSYPRLWVCRGCLDMKGSSGGDGAVEPHFNPWWLGQHPVSDRCQNLKNTGEVEIKPQGSLLLENDCGGISIVERWKFSRSISYVLGCKYIFLEWETHEFDWGRVNWFWGRVSWFYQWSMRRISPYSELIFLSWVCSGKMQQASAYLYPTEPTEPAVKGKEGHYPVSVYWAGSHWG